MIANPSQSSQQSAADLWHKAVAFHGHECPGLAIGFKAVEAVVDEFGLNAGCLPVVDEELVCITENDACGVDAIQALLGCTYGKANLIPRLRGKMAFSFYIRDAALQDNVSQSAPSQDVRSMRLCLRPDLRGDMSREEYQAFLLATPYEDLFEIDKVICDLPEPARHFASLPCSICGESTAEYALRLQEGKPVCLDCYDAYEREGF